jgi:hypothetical protein
MYKICEIRLLHFHLHIKLTHNPLIIQLLLMKTRFFYLLFTLLTFSSFGQVTFEKGYFINNENQRIECLIKNYDWKLNPKEIEYKIDENDTLQQGNLSNIKEFGIIGSSRYVRADVKIDVSPWEMDKLSKVRNPEWSEQRLFLKVLVEGKATLYHFNGDELYRFFYSVSDTIIKQLVYKEYSVDDSRIATNRKFREQLWIDMRCENAKMSSVENLDFKKAALEKYFKNYNECSSSSSIVYEKRDIKKSVHLRLTPGISIFSVSVSDSFYETYNAEFKNKLNFRIGIETEYILPFNKNKWGIIFEPTYEHISSKQQAGTATATINYNSIEFPLGLRYHFFLNNELKLFANAFYTTGFSLDFNSTITYDYPFASPLEIKTKYALAFGCGIGFKKLSAEIRYYAQRDMIDNFYWNSKYSNLSVIFGFKIW